jgi:diguanylate cyclase (GGDEF)-like protein
VRLIKYLENQSKLFSIGLGVVLVLVLAAIDYFVPREVSLAIFYLIPIGLVSWCAGEGGGILISVLSAIAWFLVNELGKDPVDAASAIPYWNTAVRLGFYLTTTYLLSELRSSLNRERKLARTDPTTGIANRQMFDELASLEIKRSIRYGHPITLAIIDLDNFTQFNAQWGKKKGDKVLQRVAMTIFNGIRETDLVARLGNDEFAILLPGTGYEPSQVALERLQKQLRESLQFYQYDISFTLGVITFMSSPKSVEEMLEKADYIMYFVKNNSPNKIEHRIES